MKFYNIIKYWYYYNIMDLLDRRFIQKRLSVLLLAVVLLLCGCRTNEFTLSQKIIRTDYRSDVEYPQIQVFRSEIEFNAYTNTLNETLETWPDHLYTPDKNLIDPLKRYTKDYFRNNILIIVSIQASSGGDRFAVGDIKKTGDALSISIWQTNSGMTCDMAAWHILIELDDSYDTAPENIELISPKTRTSEPQIFCSEQYKVSYLYA